MPIIIDHDKRRQDILIATIALFSTQGYKDVTFQKIAAACGLPRSSLYAYFKNKEDIFAFSINAKVEQIYAKIIAASILPYPCAANSIKTSINIILDEIDASRGLVMSILPYLTSFEEVPEDYVRIATYYVQRLRHVFTKTILSGMQKKDIHTCPVKHINSLLVYMLESIIFRIVVTGKFDLEMTKYQTNQIIDAIVAKVYSPKI